MTRIGRLNRRGILAALAATAAFSSIGCAPPAKQKVQIESLEELPRHTYKLEGSPSDLLKDDDRFKAFAEQVRTDVQSDLDAYQIDDAATLKEKYGALLTFDLLDGRYESALRRIEEINELETKEAAKAMSGVVTKAMIAAAHGGKINADDPAYRAAFRQYLAAAVKTLPWDVVQDDIKQAKGMAEIISESFLIGMVKAQMDPVVAQSGEVSDDMASSIVRMYFIMKMRLPLNGILAEVYGDLIDSHKVVKRDIWPEREVVLDQSQNLSPVMLAIWDSGVDVSIFADQLFVNPNEEIDGVDNDRNGYMDDVHGIAYDVNVAKSSDLLHPPGDMAGRVESVMEHMKGFMDLQAAIDSPEAAALKKHLSSLGPDEIEGFIEGLSFCGLYAHGTHVAGIAVRNNPFARILAARITFDYHTQPQATTLEIGERYAQAYHDTVEYFKQHGVRVVNMSWGWTLKEIESSLESNNIGKDAEERGRMASETLAVMSKGLSEAIASAPEILFISAAGNDDNDVDFDRTIPSSFDLPNLLIVGAVDQAGEPTSFTSMGRNVVVYANGFEVESYVPGGDRMKMSGTSMSSPNVMNLAGKLIALKPELKPGEVIELIKQGADPVKGELSYLLLNPKRSVELLK